MFTGVEEDAVTGPQVDVRRAGARDVQPALSMCLQARSEWCRGTRAADVERLRDRLSETIEDPSRLLLMARVHDRVVGLLLLRTTAVLPLTDQPALHVEQLFVAPSARGAGVGRALLSAAATVAERLGTEQVVALAPPHARQAHRFLARMGFAPLMVQRIVPTSVLRRRTGNAAFRADLNEMIWRRRSQRARTCPAALPADGSPTVPDPSDADRVSPGRSATAPSEAGGPGRTRQAADQGTGPAGSSTDPVVA
jgi:GNAT superfamily N-acetyltransferase